MPRTVDPDKTPIAWMPDEGCYRKVTHKVVKVDVPGAGVQGFEVAEFGDRVQWEDAAPGDQEDGAGRFVTYDGDDESYTATTPAAGAASEEA